mgnify:CR=1 FL=1
MGDSSIETEEKLLKQKLKNIFQKHRKFPVPDIY